MSDCSDSESREETVDQNEVLDGKAEETVESLKDIRDETVSEKEGPENCSEVMIGQCSMCTKVLPLKAVVKGGNSTIYVCGFCDITNAVMMNISCFVCPKEANIDYRIGKVYNGDIFIGHITCGKDCCGKIKKKLFPDCNKFLCECGKSAVKGLECDGCHKSFYCSEECKLKHAKTHKERCM